MSDKNNSTTATYIYHSTTSNKSFLKVYHTLKAKGIKNCAFFLRLYDKSLIKINPHNPFLSQDQKLRILAELARNPWYFFREVCRLKVSGGTIPFGLHRGNLALIWCCINSINNMSMLPRQAGKTQGVVAIFNYLDKFIVENTDFTLGNKKFSDSKLNLSRFKDMEELLPKWMLTISKDDVDNVERIEHACKKNKFTALAAGSNPVHADQLGRGFTTPIVWFDEFAFMNYNDITYDSASPAQSRAQEEAMKMGMPAFKCITTTPSDLDTPSGVFCKSMMDVAYQFDESIYEMDPVEARKYVASKSQNNFAYIEFSYIELGRSKEWFIEQCKGLNMNKIKIKRELLLEWTRTSDNSWLEEDTIDALYKYIVPEIKIRIGFKGFSMNMMKPFDPEKAYLIGADVSGGLGADSSTLVIQEIGTCLPKDRIIGYFSSNIIDTDDFTLLIMTLMNGFFKHSVFAIERNSYGLAIIQRLCKEDRYKKKLFYTEKDNSDVQKVKSIKAHISSQSGKTKVYGINTTVTSREKMLELLKYDIDTFPDTFTAKILVKELSTMGYNKSGKIEHASGCHDDHVFGYCIGRYARTFNKILSKWDKRNAFKIVDAKHTSLNTNNLLSIINLNADSNNISEKNLKLLREIQSLQSNSNSVSVNNTLNIFSLNDSN